MGKGRWDSDDWSISRASYSASARPTVDHIYKSKSLNVDLKPLDVKIRESRDSDLNPQSTALIVGLDVTGSMSRVLDSLARTGLGTLIGQIYERRPITDPHMMIMGIGDFEYDHAPLQVTQFEAENKPLVEQLEKIYLERGGGGNHYESYAAAWYFAATRTSIDCFEKRGKKGYLFTIGDEEPTPRLYGHAIKNFIGDDIEDLDGARLLQMAQTTYNVYHLAVEEGDHFSHYPERTMKAWSILLGQNVIPLADHTKLAEVIVSTIQVAEGYAHDEVVKSWSGDTALVVARAIQDVARATNTPGGMRLY